MLIIFTPLMKVFYPDGSGFSLYDSAPSNRVILDWFDHKLLYLQYAHQISTLLSTYKQFCSPVLDIKTFLREYILNILSDTFQNECHEAVLTAHHDPRNFFPPIFCHLSVHNFF